MMKGLVTMLRTMPAALVFLADSRAMRMGSTMKQQAVPARSKMTVLDEAPTMER